MTFQALLICCVYPKLATPAAARDLYTGPLFERSRRYAEQQSRPWFILSGEHGLVGPDNWLAPYDTDVSEMSAGYRSAWGAWIVAKLDREAGGLDGAVIEVHAPDSYLGPIHRPLLRAGAAVVLPLKEVPYEEWPDWYDRELTR